MLVLLLLVALVPNILLISSATDDCQCSANERYAKCPALAVGPKSCSQLGFPLPQINQSPDGKCPGPPGCLCIEGYLRNDKGVCVPKKDCRECGGDPNAVAGCGKYCNTKCSDIGGPQRACTKECKVNACDCKPGYYLDEKSNRCVLPNKCNKSTTPCTTQKSTSTSGSSSSSHSSSSSNSSHNSSGTKSTRSGSSSGSKSSSSSSSQSSNSNSQASGGSRSHSSSQSSSSSSSHSSSNNNHNHSNSNGGSNDDDEGCDSDNTPRCGADEVYSDCINGGCYTARKCSEKGQPKKCVHPKTCIKGCLCKNGYLRNNAGKCVPENKCDESHKCKGPNEEYDECPITCPPQSCNVDVKLIKCRLGPSPGDPECTPGCRCKDGHLRDDNGVCVSKDSCTDKRCDNRPHEWYDSCPYRCPPRTCDSLHKAYTCLPEDVPCKASCTCRKGYYRNSIGTCVTEENCLKCNGPNEYFSCGGACDNVCATLDKQNKTNCPIINKKCNEQCYCDDGYARNSSNICVPIDECNALQCNGPNEYYACGGACDNVCATLSQQNQTNCPIVNIKCNDMCYCDDGYARDNNNVCVPYDKCPPTCKEQNEIYSSCANGGCFGARKCSEIGKPVLCIDYFDGKGCKGDCICQEGYLRNQDGLCVPEGQCPSNSTYCTGPYEYFSNCTNGGCYGARLCSEKGAPVKCVKLIEGACESGCLCQDGYLRDYKGECVRETQCPAPPTCKGDINAHSGCGNHCGRSCATYKIAAVISCIAVCNTDACDCNYGYVFDEVTNKCVLPDDCTPTCNGDPNAKPGCGVNCGRTCDTYNKEPGSYACIQSCNLEGCDCIDGYVFDGNTGQCVLPEKCTSNDNENCNNDTGNNGSDKDDDIGNSGNNNSGTDEENNTECQSQTNSTDAEKRFADASSVLSAKFLKFLTDLDDSSFITSASSTTVPLAELFFGSSSGESQNQLKTILGLNTKEEARTVFRTWLDEFEAQENIIINLAAKIFAKNDLVLNSNFTQNVKETFDAAPENIDFSNSQQAADKMNQWVEDNTNNRIKNLVSPEMVTPDSRLFLLNAIYFKGNWKSPFNENITEKMDFYVTDDKTSQVDTMYQEARFNYTTSDALDCQALKMSYENDDYSFLVLLPNKQDGLSPLVNALQDVQKFDDVVKSLVAQKVKVWVPRFELESEIDLSKIFKSIGITLIFEAEKSGLDEMLETPESLAVTTAIQKAFIKCDEKGSEAAAANVIGIAGATAVLNPVPEFKATRPFLFFIIKGFNQILFSGAYRNPQ